MSVRVMAWVWGSSKSQPVQRLVLLAIADCANDRGTDAYPSGATLAAKTGLSERGVRKAIAQLIDLGELKVDYKKGPNGCNRYRIVMPDPAPDSGSEDTRNDVHSEQGSGSTRNVVPGTRNHVHGHPERGAPKPSSNHPPTEPSVEPSSSVTLTRPDVEKICRHLADKIADNGSKRPTITAKWRTAGRLLLDADGRTVEQVIKAIDWCQADPFWRPNIMSMPKLREKYDQLRLAAQRPNGRASPLVEVNGMRLRPETAANLQARAKWEAQDQAAIEGPK